MLLERTLGSGKTNAQPHTAFPTVMWPPESAFLSDEVPEWCSRLRRKGVEEGVRQRCCDHTTTTTKQTKPKHQLSILPTDPVGLCCTRSQRAKAPGTPQCTHLPWNHLSTFYQEGNRVRRESVDAIYRTQSQFPWPWLALECQSPTASAHVNIQIPCFRSK